MRQLAFLILLLALGLSFAGPAVAQEPTPPASPQAMLERANAALARAEEVALLAEGTVAQTSATVELVRNLAWFFGIIVAIGGIVIGLYGFNTQRGFKDTLDEYRSQLKQATDEYRESLKANQTENEKARLLTVEMEKKVQEMEKKVQEVEAIRLELSNLKQTVTSEFTAASQAGVLLSLGNQFIRDGKRDQAIEAYQEARRLQPDDPEINYRLGRAYSNAGRFEDAIMAFEKAVYARPNFPSALMELGLTYRRHAERAATKEELLAEYRLAERYLQQAIRLNPEYEDALGALGGLYRREKKYKQSLEYYKRARKVDPNSSYALNNIASLAWHEGEIELAKLTFQDVDRVATERINSGITEGFWDYFDRALARLVLGRREEAKADHLRAIAMTPEEENFRSVVDNLYFLQESETPIEGLDEFIELIEARLPEESD